MTGLFAAFLGLLAAAPARAAAPAPKAAEKPEFTSLFLGETGATPAPDGPASDYLEHADRPAGSAREEAWSHDRPDSLDETARQRPETADDADYADHADKRADQVPLSAPSASSAVKKSFAVPARGPASGDDEDAAQEGAADYERRALGRRVGRDLNPLGARLEGARAAPAPAAAIRPNELFVTVDIKEGELRDAVAGLSVAAGFRPDGRWAPGTRTVGGWIAADKLGAAATLPGIARLRVHPPGPRPPETRFESAVRLSLRLPPGETPDAALARLTAELGAAGGFRIERVLSLGRLSTGEATLVLAGRAPIRGLSRLMAHSAVYSVEPWTESATPKITADDADYADKRSDQPLLSATSASSAVQSRSPSAVPAPVLASAVDKTALDAGVLLLTRFLKFAFARAPLLVLLTLLALLRSDWLVALLRFFIPYR